MRIRSYLFTLLVAAVLVGTAFAAHSQAREQGRLLIASEVLEELRTTRDQAIPERLLERAYGIAVIPDLTKVAFFAGGRRGQGVLVVRDKQGRFSNPVFITMTGGSFGWQWGVQSTDIVLVFTTPRGVEGIAGGKVTLGADASVAAGPVGRQAEAATDVSLAEVYSYSRSRGVFAGIALDGTAITINGKGNAAFYKRPGVTASDIIGGSVTSSDDSARRFLAAVTTSAGAQRTASASHTASAAPPPAKPATKKSAASAPEPGAKAFPLADQHPGEEPK